jgi:hypothetical protein
MRKKKKRPENLSDSYAPPPSARPFWRDRVLMALIVVVLAAVALFLISVAVRS